MSKLINPLYIETMDYKTLINAESFGDFLKGYAGFSKNTPYKIILMTNL